MRSDLFSLIKTIENACDETVYTVADTEHLVRLAVAEYVLGQNALVASARVVDQSSVQKVIDRHITANISAANPHSWFSGIAQEIANFVELAYDGTSTGAAVTHVDLLPVGHPRSIRNFGLIASAHMDAVAQWVAADPRITSDAGRKAVYNAYRSAPGTLESEYATAKLEALCASGALPEELSYGALVASFKNMSFAERSARSKALAAVRRRDRRKRFANEFGRLRGFFSKGDGTMFSATGQIVGAVPNENSYNVEFDGSDADIPAGIYKMDASKSENVKATLSDRALKAAKNLRKPTGEFDQFDQDSAVDLKAFLSTKTDAPSGWTKNKDNSFTSATGNTLKEVTALPEGDYLFEGAGENNEQDLGEPLFEIKNQDGELLGVSQDWAGAQKIALTYDELKPKADTAKEPTPITDESVAEALDSLDDQANWEGAGEPEFKSPNGVLSLYFNADADTDGEGGMQDVSFWSATLDPDGEAIELGTWGGGPDDDSSDLADEVQKNYDAYKAKLSGEATPAEPEAEAPAKPVVKQTKKSKPSYLDKKPKSEQSTLKKYSQGYVSDGNDDIFVDITDNKDGTYTVDHGYTFLADENAKEAQFDEGSQTFESEKEALDFANEKLDYYNSRRVDEDAATDAFDSGLDAAPERGLGQDLPEVEAPAKEAKPLSEKQMEPATAKQYALLKELLEERDGIDENQTQAINDALANQNLSKAQMATLFGELTKKPFKPEVDPNKPSDRMIDSLRDYLVNKELTEAEISDALDQLEAGLDRAGVEKLLAKLRRRPDKAQEEGLGQEATTSDVARLAYAYGIFDFLGNGEWSKIDSDGDATVVKQGSNGKWFTSKSSYNRGDNSWNDYDEQGPFDSAEDAFKNVGDFDESLAKEWDEEISTEAAKVQEGLGSYNREATRKEALRLIDEKYDFPGGDYEKNTLKEQLETNLNELDRLVAEGDIDAARESIKNMYEDDIFYMEDAFDQALADIQNSPKEQGLGQAAPSTKMAEDATDAQYGYISSMLNSKQVPDDIAETVRQSLENKNLSKAQIGELIGKMRDLPDNADYDPNAPTPRMIDSVKRNIVAKGLSQEDQDAILAELPNMNKAEMSELIGRLKGMDDVGTPEQGLGQITGSYYDGIDLDDLGAQLDDLNDSEGVSQFDIDKKELDILSEDPSNTGLALQLAATLRDLYNKMKPTSEKGKKLEATLKNVADAIKKNIQQKLGSIEAAKYDEEDFSTLALDSAIDEIKDFLDYYYPSDRDKIVEALDRQTTIGDNRGGGWEGSIRENEDGTFTASVTSPETSADDASQTFDNREDAEDFVADNLGENNGYSADVTVRTLNEDGIEGLVAEYGDDPEVLVGKLEDAINWLNATNRGQATKIAKDLGEYVDRIRAIEAAKSETPEPGLGQQVSKSFPNADRAFEVAVDKLPGDASDDEVQLEADAVEDKLNEIDAFAADNDMAGLRDLNRNSDYFDVREDIEKAMRKLDFKMDSEVDDAIASGDLNKLESLLDDPDFSEFKLVLQEEIDQLKSEEEEEDGLGQVTPKA